MASVYAVTVCSHPCVLCGLVPLHLPSAKAGVQPGTPVHLLDPHHPVGGAAQHDPIHATLLPVPLWLAGLHYAGDLYIPISYLACHWCTQWTAQDAADILP